MDPAVFIGERPKHDWRGEEAISSGARNRPETIACYAGAINNERPVMWHVILNLIYRQSCRSALIEMRKRN